MTGQGRRSARCACALILGALVLSAPRIACADLIWESHFLDEASLTDGASVVTAGGTTIMFDRTVFSDNTGGTFDLDPYRNDDYLTIEYGPLGGHRGHLEFSMDNQNDDPDDFIELAINFDKAVTDLEFSLLDIDSGSWDDGVEVFYNGNRNVRNNPAIATILGSYVGTDNESYMHGWEGLGNNAGNGQTAGNIDFDFGSLEITSLRIRYFSTDDANNNPGGQVAGISDLTFTEAVPEASSVACMSLFSLLVLLSTFWKHRPVSAAQADRLVLSGRDNLTGGPTQSADCAAPDATCSSRRSASLQRTQVARPVQSAV